MKKTLYFIFFLCFYNTVYGQDAFVKKIKGTIFLDQNNNGVIDKNEKRLKAFRVSNGKDIVETDKYGQYELNVRVGQSVFPILPSGYTINNSTGTNIINAKFCSIPTVDSLRNVSTIDFPLVSNLIKNTDFSFGVIGDVQVDSEEELLYASNSIFTELANTENNQFNFFLGDLVNDKTHLMSDVRKQIDYINTPSFTLVGNHDREMSDYSNLTKSFSKYFGATTYAYNYGKVHFIVLNNVYSTGNKSYEGRVDDDQLEFLKNDLRYVNPSTPIVLLQHIPMYATRNEEDVLNILKGYKNVLIVSGHTHIVSRHFYNNGSIQEIGAGASCGTWWRGEKDVNGIPLALMQCGAPRGYFVIDFVGDDYRFSYKVVGSNDYSQMHIGVKENVVLANIYGGSDSTKVEIQVNNGDWMEMEKANLVDPLVDQIVEKNKSKQFPTLGNTILPLRARKSNHLWMLKFNELGQNLKINIRASDRYGFTVVQRFILLNE